jgi:hypothetical protein
MDFERSRRAFIASGVGAVAWAAKPALGPPQDVSALTLREASQMLRRKAVSAVELTQACSQRIERYNPAVNAFITVAAESALATARERQAETLRLTPHTPFSKKTLSWVLVGAFSREKGTVFRLLRSDSATLAR